MIWVAVLAGSLGVYVFKYAGLAVPKRVMDHPRMQRIATLLPIALLAALVVIQTISSGHRVTIDARAGGLAVALVAAVLRAPFLVIVVLACATTAMIRLVT